MANSGLKIAFGNKSRVGKDTAADYIIHRYGGIRLRFSKGVYDIGTDIQKILNKPIEKDPKLLQWIGLGLREVYGENIWVDMVKKQIDNITHNVSPKEAPNMVITDLRF